MIKIDFHIHTVATASDAHFEFDLDSLNSYIREAGLDAIAITNHDMFDKTQFYSIRDALDIKIFPGIEINLGSGHILVISNGDDIEEFSKRCDLIDSLNQGPDSSINVAKLKEIFPDLENYILIPHYDKKPPISKEDLVNLAEHISAGEVSSHKKFIYCQKDNSKLVPVLFSDSRISAGLRTPIRQSYLSCEEIDFSMIKNCLRDKTKVSLSLEEGNSLFKIFEDGQHLSTGLNVILGERSSGKTHTLNRIYKEYNECEEEEVVKYIEQFSLVGKNEEEDKKYFEKELSSERSLLTQDYLGGLQKVVIDMLDVDISSDDREVSEYLSSLLKFATETERHDVYTKAFLFSEVIFSNANQDGLKDLIASTKNLYRNEQFQQIVDKHIDRNSLKNLLIELME